jgi:hypothetical protein
MTHQEFLKLVANCQPHPTFNLGWNSYHPVDFADTFLPDAHKINEKNYYAVDGAELFTGYNKAYETLQIDPKTTFKIIIYTCPKGVEAATKKDKLKATSEDICYFIEIDQNEEAVISFSFGGKFKNFLSSYIKQKALQISVATIENTVYKTTINHIRTSIDTLSHYNLIAFLGNILGLNFTEVHTSQSIKVNLLDIKARKSQPNNETVTKAEKDFIIVFEIKNQPAVKYTLQVYKNNKLLFEKATLPKDLAPKGASGKLNNTVFEPGIYKAIWDCSGNDIFEVANKNTTLRFKITITDKDKRHTSGQKQIALKKFIAEEATYYNNIAFDWQRVVVWLTKDFKPPHELLPGRKDEQTNIVYAGTKLIRLKPTDRESLNTPCLFWWNNSYHIQEFPDNLLGNNNEIFGEHAGEVFMNDVKHLLNRIGEVSRKENEEYQKVIDLVTEYSNEVKFKPDIGNLGIYKEKMQIDLDNKPETIERYINMIAKFYNPKGPQDKQWFEELIIIPLSEEWFLSNSELIDRYRNIWTKDGSLNNLSGDTITSSGAYAYTKQELKTIKEELQDLQNLLQTGHFENTPEKQWLLNLNTSKLETAKRFIFIHNGTWHYPSNQIYADGIGLAINFSAISFTPLFKVILHESSQGDSYFYKKGNLDPHITIERTKKAWDELSGLPYSLNLLSNNELSNWLYQGNSEIALICLAAFLQNK